MTNVIDTLFNYIYISMPFFCNSDRNTTMICFLISECSTIYGGTSLIWEFQDQYILGVHTDFWVVLIQILTLLFIIRYVWDTYRLTRANSYFEITKELNSTKNVIEIRNLKSLISYKAGQGVITDWSDLSCLYARNITNRYQIVAHIVQRGFLDKVLFFENFSGTVMDAWDLCAPYVAKRRKESNNSIYLRRDFERLALQCWLYQLDQNFRQPLNLLDNNHNVCHIEADESGISKVRDRIQKLKRKPFLIAADDLYWLTEKGCVEDSQKTKNVST